MDFTSLPNLHPAVLHFPIALVPLALLFDFVALALRRFDWLDRAAATLWLAAGIAAYVTVESGESAADGLVGVPAAVEPLIGTHSDWAHWTLYALVVFGPLRLGATLWDPKRQRVAARWALLLPELALLALVAHTADLGGELVYGHGVAVTKTPAVGPRAVSTPGESADREPAEDQETEESTGDPSDRLTEGEDGRVVWQPAPGDRDALGTVVTALGGTTLDDIQAIESAEEGLLLQIANEGSGETWLALPGTFGDVRVEAEVDTTGFAGEVGLFHHAESPAAAGLLIQTTDGRQTLWEVRGEGSRLGAAEHRPPKGVYVLAVSAAGKHLKGLVDGASVTHGHIEPGPEGHVGLLLRGRGTVRLVRLSAQPL